MVVWVLVEQNRERTTVIRASATASLTRDMFRATWNHGIITSIYEIFLSSLPQQPFSAAFLCSFSQPFSAAFLRSFSQQPFSAIILLWSGVGGQLLPSSCCGQGLAVSYFGHLAVVRGWWSALQETRSLKET